MADVADAPRCVDRPYDVEVFTTWGFSGEWGPKLDLDRLEGDSLEYEGIVTTPDPTNTNTLALTQMMTTPVICK